MCIVVEVEDSKLVDDSQMRKAQESAVTKAHVQYLHGPRFWATQSRLC